MISARTTRRASLLPAALLAALCLGAGEADAQAVQVVPSPDLAITRAPAPVQLMIYLTQRPVSAPSPQRPPVTCPRHTKWRVDCTPVSQP
jgi:hypothetical protein